MPQEHYLDRRCRFLDHRFFMYYEDIIIRLSVINVEFGFFRRKCCFCYTLFLFTFAKIPWISIICFLCMLKTCVYADMDMGRPVRLLRFAFSLFLCIKSLLFLLQLDSTWYENVVVKENGKGKSNLFLGCSPYRMTLKRWTGLNKVKPYKIICYIFRKITILQLYKKINSLIIILFVFLVRVHSCEYKLDNNDAILQNIRTHPFFGLNLQNDIICCESIRSLIFPLCLLLRYIRVHIRT